MFSLFRKCPTVQDLHVPAFWGQLVRDQSDLRQWGATKQDMALLLYFFDKKNDLLPTPDLSAICSFYREQVVEVNGGLLEAECDSLQGVDFVRTPLKLP